MNLKDKGTKTKFKIKMNTGTLYLFGVKNKVGKPGLKVPVQGN